MLGWMNHELGTRLPEVSTTSDDTILMTESEEEIKSLLMKVKEESEKPGLTFKPQKSKVIASGPITSWQIEEEKLEAVPSLLSFGSKITEDSDCSYAIKRHLFLLEESICLTSDYTTKLQSSRQYGTGTKTEI